MSIDKNLKDFWNLLYPSALEENEYIRILGTLITSEGKKISKPWFIKSVDELQEIIQKNKYKYNLYTNLATVKTVNDKELEGKLENMYRRKVLYLDFDRKHFNGKLEHNDVLKRVKAKFPSLYYSYTVDSGGGYHVYYLTQETEEIEHITKLNYDMAKCVGADLDACITTQIARIPTSVNLKDRSRMKNVNAVVNDLHKAIPITLKKLQYILPKIKESEFTKTDICFYCVQNMIATGADKGSRNFCLGRIVNYLRDVQKCTEKQALIVAHEFNDRCRPSKGKSELEAEFKKYWDGNYCLLGCKIDDPNKMAILEKYCDKYSCKTAIQYEESFTVEENSTMKIHNEYFRERCLKSMNGNHYLILILLLDSDGLTTPQLKQRLISAKTKRLCMKDDDLYTIIRELEEWNIIESNTVGRTKHLKVKDIPNYCKGYTQISTGVRSFLINKLINKNDFMIYLLLKHRCRQGEKCTQEVLSDLVGLNIKTVRECIQRLKQAYIIDIVSIPTERGLFYNRYVLKM